MWEIISRNEASTMAIGEELGKLLSPGDVVTLSGDLGAGKTVFVHGVAKGLAARDPVSSPSFLIVQEYRGKYPIFHADFYRLKSPLELEGIGWDDYLNRRGVTLIEWGERFPEVLPEERLEVVIATGSDFGSEGWRLLSFRPDGEHYQEMVEGLAERCSYLA